MADDWHALPTLDLAAIAELAGYEQWVCWREEERAGKPTKIPMRPRDGQNASVTKPDDWSSYQAAYNYAKAELAVSGIGFVLTRDDPFTGVDLDKCHDPLTGAIEPFALEIAERLQTYTEVSPSGLGLRLISRGRSRHPRSRVGRVEIYAERRFVTITGNRLSRWPETIADAGDALTEIMTAAFEAAPSRPARQSERPDLGRIMAVLQDAVKADAEPPFERFEVLCENAPIVRQTWDHSRRDTADWSLSEYDLALANYFLAAGWSHEEIARGLVAHRRKHGGDKLDRADYYARTILAAYTNRTMDEAQARLDPQFIETVPEDGQRQAVLNALSELYGVRFCDIVKYVSDPPAYVIHTEKGAIRGGIDIVINQAAFRKGFAETVGILFAKCREREWERRAQRMLDICRLESIGEEAKQSGQMEAWLVEYLHHKPVARPGPNGEDIEAGHPFLWSDRGGRIAVLSRDFTAWLLRVKGIRLNGRDRGMMLRALNCEPDTASFRTRKGLQTSASVWLVPTGVADAGIGEER